MEAESEDEEQLSMKEEAELSWRSRHIPTGWSQCWRSSELLQDSFSDNRITGRFPVGLWRAVSI